MSERCGIAVVGATGAVGLEALSILAERGFHVEQVLAFASDRSDGVVVPFGASSIRVRAFDVEALQQCRLALFCASAEFARAHAPGLAASGITVIDNSSAFRADPAVPLVVPEINADQLAGRPTLIANPNCSTIILLLALEPLRRAFGVERVTVSTYQAVSGAGLPAIAELEAQTRSALEGHVRAPNVFPVSCAFNVFTHESAVDPETGINGEEAKMISESRRIWRQPSLDLTPTCVRVPVRRAHSQSVVVELGRDVSVDEACGVIDGAPGVRLWSDRSPTPLDATGQDEVLVGRVRLAPVDAELGWSRRLLLWICGDQLRRGAALNAIQIADELGLLKPCSARAPAALRA